MFALFSLKFSQIHSQRDTTAEHLHKTNGVVAHSKWARCWAKRLSHQCGVADASAIWFVFTLWVGHITVQNNQDGCSASKLVCELREDSSVGERFKNQNQSTPS